MKDIIDLKMFFASLLRPIINEAIKENLETHKVNNATTPQFLSPKEFAHLTGMKYSTVVYHCNVGKLKARQDGASCSWQISSSELDRFQQEAKDNL